MRDRREPKFVLEPAVSVRPLSHPVATEWAELEATRERHERALAEHKSARREEALITERRWGGSGRCCGREDALRGELEVVGVRIRAARSAATRALVEALETVAERGEGSEAQLPAERAQALAEREELLAKARDLDVRAHSDDRLEAWPSQARSSSRPTAFGGSSSFRGRSATGRFPGRSRSSGRIRMRAVACRRERRTRRSRCASRARGSRPRPGRTAASR